MPIIQTITNKRSVGGSFSATIPVSPQVGNYLVALLYSRGTTAPTFDTAGFSVLANPQLTGPSPGPFLRVALKKVGSATDTSCAVTVGSHATLALLEVSDLINVSSVSDLLETYASNQNTSTSTTSLSVGPTATSSVNDGIAIIALGINGDSGGFSGAFTNTFTEVITDISQAGSASAAQLSIGTRSLNSFAAQTSGRGWTTGRAAYGVLILLKGAGGTAPLNATLTANTATAVSGEVVTLTLNGSGGSGTINGYNITQTAGPSVTLSGSGNTRTFTAGTAGSSYVFSGYVTDDEMSSSIAVTETVNVIAQPNSAALIAASSDPGITIVGAASIETALSDNSDTSYVQSGIDPSNQKFVLQYGSVPDPTISSGYRMRARVSVEGASSASIVVELVELAGGAVSSVLSGAGVVRASRTITDASALPATYEWELTAIEADSIISHSALFRRFTMTTVG